MMTHKPWLVCPCCRSSCRWSDLCLCRASSVEPDAYLRPCLPLPELAQVRIPAPSLGLSSHGALPTRFFPSIRPFVPTSRARYSLCASCEPCFCFGVFDNVDTSPFPVWSDFPCEKTHEACFELHEREGFFFGSSCPKKRILKFFFVMYQCEFFPQIGRDSR